MLWLVTKTWTFWLCKSSFIGGREGFDWSPTSMIWNECGNVPLRKEKDLNRKRTLRFSQLFSYFLFFFSMRGFPNSTGLSTSMESFSITDTRSQLKLLKQLPNLIPKVTYLSHKEKMQKCIIVWIPNRAGINMKRLPLQLGHHPQLYPPLV